MLKMERFWLRRQVVIWFPNATRECFMFGLRWRNHFIGFVLGGEEVDPRHHVHNEQVRKLTELLERREELLVKGKTLQQNAEMARQREANETSLQGVGDR